MFFLGKEDLKDTKSIIFYSRKLYNKRFLLKLFISDILFQRLTPKIKV